MSPCVSVIIPVYNVEPYLEECIDSVRNQTYKNIEIILVDDGSTDGSVRICNKYTQIDHRVKVIHQENMGVSCARNKGINAASSDWIMFVDADDWIESDAISVAIQKVSKDIDLIILPFCNAVNSSFKYVDYNITDNRIDFLGACRVNNTEYFPDNMKVGLRLTSQCAKLYNKSIIEKNHIVFPEDIKDNEDSIFNFQYILQINKALFINYPMYHVRERDNSASRSNIGKGDRVVQSLSAFDMLLRQNNLEKEMRRYQSIDAFLKIVQIFISYSKMHSKQGYAFSLCYKECKKSATEQICRRLINQTKVVEIYSLINKAVVVCLKLHLYGLVFLLFDLYYSKGK